MSCHSSQSYRSGAESQLRGDTISADSTGMTFGRHDARDRLLYMYASNCLPPLLYSHGMGIIFAYKLPKLAVQGVRCKSLTIPDGREQSTERSPFTCILQTERILYKPRPKSKRQCTCLMAPHFAPDSSLSCKSAKHLVQHDVDSPFSTSPTMSSKILLTFSLALADASVNAQFHSFAMASPSDRSTCLCNHQLSKAG